ncbi:MAG: polyprenyl diphosphate synthase [Candidatus Aenigmarchaeota archaeon]|nr:polyprenyl diphosphate synthase [Candidatus Aenigmarchaeota archaeon]
MSPVNRRWARAHGMPPWKGHWFGAKKIEKFLKWCIELKISQVSVYTLSTENLERPKRELDELFKIFYFYLNKLENGESNFLEKYRVRVRFIGDLEMLPPRLVKLIGKVMQKTAKYQKRVINFLIGYGGKFEITQAIRAIVEECIKKGKVEITEKSVEKKLLVSKPVDLLIRTGGEMRLSNFLLWQTAYSEIIFLKKFWPDFEKKDLIRCIEKFNQRKRRFGK